MNKELVLEKFSENKLVSSILNFVKTNNIIVKSISFCLVLVLSVVVTVMSIGLTIGFNVNYSGKMIATIRDTSVFEKAREIVVNEIGGFEKEEAINSPKFVMTLTVAENLCEPTTLANVIIENTDEIVLASALMVNGETVATTETANLTDLIEARRTSYFVEGAENTASFTEKLEIKDGYCLKSELSSTEEITEAINNLEVRTVSTIVSEKTVPHTVKKLKTQSYKVGYSKVYQAGQDGLVKTTTTKETVNGASVCEDKISTDVITEAVQQIEIIGIANEKITATEKANASSKGFIFPLKKGTYKISSYYGDGRNHKGVDLCASKGTAIFAVAKGTVTYAGYDSDFGYNVIVDHGNGIKTRYAHASALCVSKGATVAQGDMIAAVGNTGWSTGNHLHFEVIVNGVRVNPAPYIGL